jgi:hypothetical protein
MPVPAKIDHLNAGLVMNADPCDIFFAFLFINGVKQGKEKEMLVLLSFRLSKVWSYYSLRENPKFLQNFRSKNNTSEKIVS